MGIRELLQTELWNKRTTRRILFGTLVVIALSTFGLKVWQAYQYYWLTDSERTAARIALQNINDVRKTNAASYEEFNAIIGPEKKTIAAANAAAVTERDQITVMQLEGCDLEVTNDRLNAMLQQIPAVTPRQTESKAVLQLRYSKSADSTRGKCEALHKALY